jgi:hypothetical protein
VGGDATVTWRFKHSKRTEADNQMLILSIWINQMCIHIDMGYINILVTSSFPETFEKSVREGGLSDAIMIDSTWIYISHTDKH